MSDIFLSMVLSAQLVVIDVTCILPICRTKESIFRGSVSKILGCEVNSKLRNPIWREDEAENATLKMTSRNDSNKEFDLNLKNLGLKTDTTNN